MKTIDILIIATVTLGVAAAVFAIIRNRKKGKKCCGCDGCSNCQGCDRSR